MGNDRDERPPASTDDQDDVASRVSAREPGAPRRRREMLVIPEWAIQEP